MLEKITIAGSGSWATALVKLFSESGVRVSWLVRGKESADYIRANGHNPRYLSYASLNMDLIEPVADPLAALEDTEMVLFATPSAFLKDMVKTMDLKEYKGKYMAVSIKGFVPGTGLTPSLYIAKKAGLSPDKIAVIGGPCHAEEMANRKTTYVTVSAKDPVLTEALAGSLNVPYAKVIQNGDPVGIEFAAIIKNIIGIASGLASGLNYGDNFQAVLIINAMYEASQLIQALDSGSRNLYQSSYFGDLLVTAYSDHSRNRMLGKFVGRGIQVNKALQAMEMVAEGFFASKELAPLVKKLGLNLPVINTVYRVLYQHANPFHEFQLLERQLN